VTRNLRAVLFDLDDTLIVEMPIEDRLMRDVLRPVAERHGLDLDHCYHTVREEADKLWVHAPAYRYCDQLGFCAWEGMWSTFESSRPEMAGMQEWGATFRRQAWAQALEVLGVREEGLAERLAEEYQEARRNTHIVFDDVEEVLADLKKDYRLGILTNGAQWIQRTKIDGSRLEHYFETTVITGDVGVGKPGAPPFLVALDNLGVAPEETAMVGNSLTSDVRGAQNLGLFAVWLNRDDAWHQPGITPDAEIRTLRELRDVLERA
jgi:putative hydrolase of the HAD superfamily